MKDPREPEISYRIVRLEPSGRWNLLSKTSDPAEANHTLDFERKLFPEAVIVLQEETRRPVDRAPETT